MNLVLRWPTAIALGLTACFLAPLLADPTAIVLNDDWTQILAFQGYLRDQLLEFGALPQRSHVLGSGFPIVGHPEYPVISPLTLPVLLFGVAAGTKVAVMLVHLLGVYGMWLLCRRRLGLAELPSLYATLVFAVGGWLPAIMASGNYPQIHFSLFPLLLALALPDPNEGTDAKEGRWFDRRVALAAVVGATTLLDGHLNAVACFVFLMLSAASVGRVAFVRAGLATLGAGCLAAYKLAPTLALLSLADRSVEVGAIEAVQFDWQHWIGLSGTADSYALGYVPWLLALGSLWLFFRGSTSQKRRVAQMLGLLVLALVLWAGPTSPVNLFGLLHELPVMRSMDAPGKYFAFFVGFYALILGALAIAAIPASWPRWLAPLGMAASFVPLMVTGMVTFGGIFDRPDVPHELRRFVSVDTEYFVAGGERSREAVVQDPYLWYRHGIGTLRWEDNFQLPAHGVPAWNVGLDGTAAANPAYQGEVWVEPTSTIESVTLDSLSANRMRATVPLGSTGWLVFNQNYDSGWSCTGETVDRDGRLGVVLDGVSDAVACRYTSRPLRWGALISLLTALLMMGVLWWRARRAAKRPRPAWVVALLGWYGARDEPARPGLERSYYAAGRLLLALGLVWIAAMSWLQWQRLQANVHSEYEDDALYLQVLDGVGRLDVPANTIHPDHRPSHFTPAFYGLWPAWMLLGGGWLGVFIIKSLAIGMGAWAAFLMAARRRLSPRASLTFGILWLVWPPSIVLVTSTLRPLMLAAGPLMFMLAAYDARRFREFCAWAAVVVLFREDLALTVGLASGLALLERRPLRWVLGPGLAATAWLVVATQLLIPAMLDTELAALLAAANLGEAPLVERGVHAANVMGIMAILAPLAFFSLGSRLSLVGLVGVLSILINVNPFRANLVHLLTPAIVAVFAGALVAVSRWGTRFLPALCVTCALVHMQSWVPPTLSMPPQLVDGAEPVTTAWSPLHPALYRPTATDAARWAAVGHIPAEASAAGAGHLLPMLAPRAGLYGYGHKDHGYLRAEYLILEDVCVGTAAGNHASVPPGRLREHQTLLTGAGYVVHAREGGVVVLRRTGEPVPALARALEHLMGECGGYDPEQVRAIKGR